ncbi:MAG: class I SAM-dependent DNA methyltransferase [Anaerolineae bacterium]|nr:class I SAM-dependent DNA methyltransferase [Anaerolineae bacterium]
MTPETFVAKWSKIQQKETAVAQSHFNDVCQLVGHLPPLAYDPAGQHFAFETQTVKPGGQKGFADVFFRDHFIWEYKGPHKDLGKAYAQLQLYREDLHNPPLLITSDIHTIIIHTNFNNYPTIQHTITFDDLLRGEGLEKLRWAFFHPDRFKPDKTQAEITKASADTFIAVAEAMKRHQAMTGEVYTPEQLAHFLARLLFCLFAEDLDLLPHNVFSQIVRSQGVEHADLQFGLRNLFREMRGGGVFGFYRIREFDGTLFDDEFVPTIPAELARSLLQAAEQNWAQVDPAIFGTLFERVIDPEKRAQLGAHYTSVADIMLIVEPVLLEPLRRRWDEVRRQVDRELRQVPGTAVDASSDAVVMAVPGTSSAHQLLADFAAEIAAVRVLDPACGSGNFLYVALRQLLDLQKQVIAYAARRGLPEIPLTVGPEQLLGIEINPYAHELAQITAWIGYLQWRHENGFQELPMPILSPLHNIKRMDAIQAVDENGRLTEPTWPAADIIISNPPFLGGKRLKTELGSAYVEQLFQIYEGRVAHEADLVCYWFEKARAMIEMGTVSRAGLLATNSIRGGPNRQVLDRIKQSGDIFMAWSDRPWILEGAAVRVSIVGFDNGRETHRVLDGKPTPAIYANLANTLDLSQARRLEENGGLSFMGVTPAGPFEIDGVTARRWLAASNSSGRLNGDVIRPYYNGNDLSKRPRDVWIVDFGVSMPLAEASLYELPFQYVQEAVYPLRQQNNRAAYREKWWLLAESRSGMRNTLKPLKRYMGTSMVSKHRFFQWLTPDILPANLVIVISREDDYFFGMLHSWVHQLWALRLGTSLEDRPRYTPTSTFETFPFPWPPGQEPAESADPRVAEIAHWARALHGWREAWLNPPPPPGNTIDVAHAKMVQNRTLTNLYNGLVYYRETRPDRSSRPVRSAAPFDRAEFGKVTRHSVSRAEIEELDDIHTALDRAVLDAYGWPPDLGDEEILERLLALNLQRAGN